MSTTSPILAIPQVAPTQNSKESTINTGMSILEAASNAAVAVDASAGNVVLTTTQWTRYFLLRITGHTVARTITVPATSRFVCIHNEGTASITLHVAGSSGQDLVIAAAKVVLAQADGVDVSAISSGIQLLAQLSDVDLTTLTDGDSLIWSAADSKFIAGAVGNSLASLTDVDLTGLSDGDTLVWNASTSQFEPGSSTGPLSISAKTADYTLAVTDANSVIEVNKATAVTITIPTNATAAIEVGEQVSIAQAGVGQVTLAPASGVTLLYAADLLPETRAQNTLLTAIKTATNTWRVTGDLAAA